MSQPDIHHLMQQGGTWTAREVDAILNWIARGLGGSVAQPAPASSPLEAVEQLRADIGAQIIKLGKAIESLHARLDALEAKPAAPVTTRASAPAARAAAKPAAA